jgi:hypothetical protein
MFTDKTLTATNEAEAISQVQAIFPESYVYCFGLASNGFDVAVYDSEDDFDSDSEEGDNYRIKARYAIALTP